VLLISGRITGEEVDLLRRLLDQEADPPAIDLGSVMLVEPGGRGTTRTKRSQRK